MPSEPRANARFPLCERCLPDYRVLRFVETARLQGNIVPYASIMWEDEQALMPLWRGFQRLRITGEQRDIIRGCVRSAQDFFEVFGGGGDAVDTEEIGPGIERFPIRVDLTEEESEPDQREDGRPTP
jgi:hypothetical protein